MRRNRAAAAATAQVIPTRGILFTAEAQRAPIAMPMQPFGYLVLDIETANGEPMDAERWMREQWSPSPTWKAETIGTKYLEMLEKKKERLALLDAAPVICISLKSETELRCLHSMKVEQRAHMGGRALIEGFADQAGMLKAFGGLMAARCGPETVIAGHNVKGFDLRKLRLWIAKLGLPMPMALQGGGGPGQPVYDIMQEFCHRFSVSREIMVSLAMVLEELGIESHKKLVSGAEIPKLFEAGEFGTIVDYALLDVLAEEEAYLRMSRGVMCS